MNDINVWTAQDVKNAIVQDNANLELIFSNYLKGFVSRLGDYDISIQAISSVENLQKQILQSIDSLEAMRREIISVIDLFSTCNHPLLLKYLHGFLFRILTSSTSSCSFHYRLYCWKTVVSMSCAPSCLKNILCFINRMAQCGMKHSCSFANTTTL